MQADSIRYEALTSEDEAVLTADREVLPAIVRAHFPNERLSGSEADLPLIQRVLGGAPYAADAVAEAVALDADVRRMVATGEHR